MNILNNRGGTFTFILKDDTKVTYTNWEDIPDDFKHVIEFKPTIPLPPHTPEQHLEIAEWNDRFTKLLEIERNARRN